MILRELERHIVQQFSLGRSIVIGLMGKEIEGDWGEEDRNKGERSKS